jgi:hypothetical protein
MACKPLTLEFAQRLLKSWKPKFKINKCVTVGGFNTIWTLHHPFADWVARIGKRSLATQEEVDEREEEVFYNKMMNKGKNKGKYVGDILENDVVEFEGGNWAIEIMEKFDIESLI